MKLIRVNKTSYINPEHIVTISYENDIDEDTKQELETKSWYIGMVDGAEIKTNKKFSVRLLLKECR